MGYTEDCQSGMEERKKKLRVRIPKKTSQEQLCRYRGRPRVHTCVLQLHLYRVMMESRSLHFLRCLPLPVFRIDRKILGIQIRHPLLALQIQHARPSMDLRMDQ